MVRGPMIGVQDGMLVRPIVSPQPEEPVRLATGDDIRARRYTLSGDLDLELWYDPSDTAAELRSPAADGWFITYERLLRLGAQTLRFLDVLFADSRGQASMSAVRRIAVMRWMILGRAGNGRNRQTQHGHRSPSAVNTRVRTDRSSAPGVRRRT
jgi:hypothetical protein